MPKRNNPARKRRRLGNVINVHYFAMDGGHYWVEVPGGVALDGPILANLWLQGAVHGPFPSLQAAESDSQKTLLGADCEVTDMGKFPSSGGLH